MYEENSYNEKVDVYAFGMCLLEIFTKEIPYSECSNPAQIYRKVIAGEPPEVLSRLQSRHAREFVLLCLGYRDDNGNFIRPTVSELLQHPFLEKRANDDDEVVVDLPPRHVPQDSLSEPSSNTTPTVKRRVSTHSSQTLHHHNNSTNGDMTHSRESSFHSESIPVVPNDVTPKQSRSSSVKQSVATSPKDDEEDGDRFEEMQESEISMRKVKVLMGRGQELKDDDDEVPSAEAPNDSVKALQESNGSSQDAIPSSDANLATQSCIPSPHVDNQQNSTNNQEAQVPFQYLVNAAVLENENPNIRPYIDDILKLVVTLPVDGQTQNVQFDFHLIEDDPVQVAKEMVKELGIPQGAVLEISETISGLARSARMKQDKHAARLQSLPPTVVPVPVQVSQVVPVTQVQTQAHQPGSQIETIQFVQDQQQQLPTLQAVQPILPSPQHVLPQIPATATAQQQDLLKYQGVPQTMQPLTMTAQQPTILQDLRVDGMISQMPLHTNDVAASLPYHAMAPLINDQQYLQQQNNTVTHSRQVLHQPVPVSYAVPEPMQYHSQPVPEPVQYHSQSDMHLVRPSDQSNYNPRDVTTQQPQQATLAGTLKEGLTSVPQVKSDLAPTVGRPPMQVRQRSGDSDKSSENKGQVPDLDAPTQQHLNHAPQPYALNHTIVHPTEPHMKLSEPQSTQSIPPIAVAQSVAPLSQQGTNQVQQWQPREAEIISVISNRSELSGEAQYDSQLQQRPYNTVAPTNVDGQSTQSEGDSDDEDDVDIADELRKLDEDFQKNLERAKKVFVNRMDNLQRSQIEREAQHLKTLEKHEKERAEFEKRLAQETEQQQRRIEQLQREWDKKRETIAIQKKKQKDGSMSLNHSDPQSEMTLGHLRSISATSSNFSLSPAMSVHKQQEPNGDKT
jgi:hypothetical protein